MLSLAVEKISSPMPEDYSISDDYDLLQLSCRNRARRAPVSLRTGNFKTSLIEFDVDSSSGVLLEITVVCFDTIRQPIGRRVGPQLEGAPVLQLPRAEDLRGPEFVQRFDVEGDFSLAFGPDFVEVDLGALAQADSALSNYATTFMLLREEIVGFRVDGLDRIQIDRIARGATI